MKNIHISVIVCFPFSRDIILLVSDILCTPRVKNVFGVLKKLLMCFVGGFGFLFIEDL